MSGVLPPWTLDEQRERNVHHVFPLYGREHDTEGGECWCSPEVEPVVVDGVRVGSVVIHREEN